MTSPVENGEQRKVGRPKGTPNPNGGRITNNLRGLDIADMGVQLSPQPNWYAADITIYKCGDCGSVWWEGYNTTAYNWDGEETEEAASVYREGKPERHGRKCPSYEENIF